MAVVIAPGLTGKQVAAEAPAMYDVLIYSANAAGVAAAVTSSGFNKHRVLVVEPLEMIGGMAAAGGVALMNQGGCGLTGLSKNWSMLCGEYYYGFPTMMTPERAPFPSMNVSEMAFWKLLRSRDSIDVKTGCHATTVTRATGGAPGCLGQVDFLCDNRTRPMSVQASFLIDASYDGDLLVLAGGIDYTSGREPRSKYNESLAGVNTAFHNLESFVSQNLSSINPFFPNGTVIPGVDPNPISQEGSGDDKLMAFQYFACLSNTPGNMVPFYPPPGYNPDDFTLLLRQSLGLVANGKYPDGPPLDYFGAVQCYDEVVEKVTGHRDCLYCCGTGPVDADQPNLNAGWASANYSRKREIEQAHRYYIQGSLYFMANDPRMPNGTRKSSQGYGYCKDEYAKHSNFPPQMYVRVSNRLQGESLLTQNNIVNPQVKPDAVAMGCWTFDQHTMSRNLVTDQTGQKTLRNEGFMRAALGSDGLSCDHPKADCSEGASWYDVPYGTMVPKRGQASNLLVPVVISATSIAYASTRIENMFMDLGSAAGVAVAQLLDDGASPNPGSCPSKGVQDADIDRIQEVLQSAYGQQIHGKQLPPTPPAPPTPPTYTVVGAGGADWDGVYHRSNSSSADGRPVYVLATDPKRAIYSYDKFWRIAIMDKEIYYVAGRQTPSSNPDPPLTGWVVANGTSPAPHLTQP